MFIPLNLLLLLLACYMHPLAAKVTVSDLGMECCRGPLNVSEELLRDCYAALSLVPNTNISIDPHYMNIHHPGPGSQKPISLELTGNDTYKINGDKVRVPAVFSSGICLVHVTAWDGRRRLVFPEDPGPALFQHIYFWPLVRKQVKGIIDDCLMNMLQRGETAILTIGTSSAKLDAGNRPPLTVYSQVIMSTSNNSNIANIRNSPYTRNFPKIDKYHLPRFNVYTPTGQINDIRWPTSYHRPPKPRSTELQQ